VSGLLGICADDNTIRFTGSITLVAHDLGANKNPVFVGTNGELTPTEPTTEDFFSRIVAYVEDEDRIRVSIDENWYTIGEDLIPLTTITSGDSPFIVTNLHTIIEVDASGGDVELDFPTSSGNSSQEWTITRIDDDQASDYEVTLDPFGGELINGEATLEINFQHTSLNIYANGTGLGIK